jgi:hypothetical protein
LIVSLILLGMLINDLTFLPFVLHVCFICGLVISFTIYIRMLCCFCNWPSGCSACALINMNLIEINWIELYYVFNYKTQIIHNENTLMNRHRNGFNFSVSILNHIIACSDFRLLFLCISIMGKSVGCNYNYCR